MEKKKKKESVFLTSNRLQCRLFGHNTVLTARVRQAGQRCPASHKILGFAINPKDNTFKLSQGRTMKMWDFCSKWDI